MKIASSTEPSTLTSENSPLVTKDLNAVSSVKSDCFKASMTSQREAADMDEMTNGSFECTVSWVNNIGEFYISPLTKSKLFEQVLLEIQEPVKRIDTAHVGLVCCCKLDDIWYRVRIEKISPDKSKVKLFFMDIGRNEKMATQELMHLKNYQDLPPLVQRVGLSGVQPLEGDTWSMESTETFKELIGMEDGQTFLLAPITKDEQGWKVTLSFESEDVAEMLIKLEQVQLDGVKMAEQSNESQVLTSVSAEKKCLHQSEAGEIYFQLTFKYLLVTILLLS